MRIENGSVSFCKFGGDPEMRLATSDYSVQTW